MGEHGIRVGKDRGLGQELAAVDVRGHAEQLVLGAEGDDELDRLVSGQGVDQPLHQLDVGGTEGAEAEIDERASAACSVGSLPRRLGTSHAGFERQPAAR
jgi:hypothetical protein